MAVSVRSSEIIHEALRACGTRLLSALPETWLVHLIRLGEEDPATTLVRLAKEEEGVGLSMGAHLGGVGSAMLMQNHGFLASVNGIVSGAQLYRIPLLMLISQRGEFGERDPWQTEGGLATEHVLRALRIPFERLDSREGLARRIRQARTLADAAERPVALLLRRDLMWEETPEDEAPEAGSVGVGGTGTKGGDGGGDPAVADDAAAGGMEDEVPQGEVEDGSPPSPMRRLDALRALHPLLDRPRVAVVTNMGGVAAELQSVGHRPNFFYLQHAMGLASSLGLGLALARPDLRVVVLDGDGSVLMNLGGFTTLARYRPPNLTQVIFDNRSLLSVGGFPTATATGSDLAGIARSSGVPRVARLRTVEGLVRALGAAMEGDATTSLVARVDEHYIPPERTRGFVTPLGLLENRYEFARRLREGPGAAETEP